jgi:hypothetical protein
MSGVSENPMKEHWKIIAGPLASHICLASTHDSTRHQPGEEPVISNAQMGSSARF